MLNLYDASRKLIKNRSVQLTLKDIEKDTHLSSSWLNKLISGDLKNPSYFKLEKLYNYLLRKKAEYESE